MALSAALMQPVPFGLTVRSHDPAVVDGAVGGNGKCSTVTGSGAGAGGALRTSGMSSFAHAACAARLQVPISAQTFPARARGCRLADTLELAELPVGMP